ncbi:hypothetical protein TGVAND_437940 [Toxoplasma gondii VAND]|uniref:Secreted protein n=1 Tax=Toxoplasma gondii VAND TaxID=933077 RepID=A0A086PNP0_TOXGO|nr:hypothetical protein TGVAND_437940 [Toxoplasma gondii VAND]
MVCLLRFSFRLVSVLLTRAGAKALKAAATSEDSPVRRLSGVSDGVDEETPLECLYSSRRQGGVDEREGSEKGGEGGELRRPLLSQPRRRIQKTRCYRFKKTLKLSRACAILPARQPTVARKHQPTLAARKRLHVSEKSTDNRSDDEGQMRRLEKEPNVQRS